MSSNTAVAFQQQAPRPKLSRVAADLRPHWRPLAVGSLAAIVVAVVSAAGPLLIGWTIDQGVIAGDVGRVLTWSAVFGALSIVNLFAMRLQVRAMGRFANAYLKDVREDLLVRLYRLDLDFFQHTPSGRVVARLTSDVDNLQQFVENGLGLLTRVVLTVAVTVLVMAASSPQLTLVVLAVLSPLAIVVLWFRWAAFTAQVAVRDRMSEVLGHVNELLIGIRVIQAFTYEGPRLVAFDRVNWSTQTAKVKTARLNATLYSVVELLNPIAIATVVGVGALMVTDGTMTVGVVIAFLLYVGRLFEPIQQLAELAQVLQQAFASYAKVFQFRDLVPGVADAPNAVAHVPGPGRIEFRDVSFRYAADRPVVIDHLDLVIEAGTRVAVVGSSGAGKSTIAKLIARFHDISSGELLIDGQRPADLVGESLRRNVVVVPQEGYLFTGTVAQNIAMGRPGVDRSEVDRACRSLGILGRLNALPQGLDTMVENRGQSLSSGQRQLVALARAFIVDPAVVVLDEATSNLDPATDALIEDAMAVLQRDRTAIVIAHRVETAMRADRIVMMSAGRVVEDGAPGDLMGGPGAFARWVEQVRQSSGGVDARQ